MSYKIITKEEPHSVVTEQYKKVRTAIDFSSIDKKVKVINLTSTFPSEGKTVTSINLAMVYAQTGKKVLLVDMDLRIPKIHRFFNLPNKDGISGYVDSRDIKKCIQKGTDNLDILVTGKKTPFPSELLASKVVNEMMEKLRDMYDVIIIDCPPMTAVTDASIISNFSDGTVYVLASRRTNRDMANKAINDLKKNGANILGGVLTRVSKRDSNYGADYYYYYGE
ncbi:Tyrosine-protein kinase YwqD [Candidatus Izimaplasma bacterium HR1]|uniref:CpsD/CapB family tyrosine-protein kinase n=1 Tax=Candidatus Izimoplasma sp. HR1 TaxID=1541959 RepID=UPI0004F60680|nr:Tyrosine-protein kinase YwqD [Candidatus Izimaplasma bacterium HR1]